MKVCVGSHGRFHAFHLAAGLYHLGALESLQSTYPYIFIKHAIGFNIPTRTAPSLEILRTLGVKFGDRHAANVLLSERFGRFLAKYIRRSHPDILVGWSSSTLEAIPVAHDRGIKVIVERGSSHIAQQTEVLSNAYAALGITSMITHPQIIERELEEYALADAISVPSEIAAQSFVENGIDRDRIIVNQLGVDVSRFQPDLTRGDKQTIRILFAGQVGVRKGVATLLHAFKSVTGPVELQLVGPIEPAFADILATLPLERVIIEGPVERDSIPRLLRRADIFCLPSFEEGFGMVAAEAMASGLPVILSDQVGACDIVTHGQNGWIVPVNDPRALADAITRFIEDKDARQQMGTAARQTAQSLGGWHQYVKRAYTHYQELLAR